MLLGVFESDLVWNSAVSDSDASSCVLGVRRAGGASGAGGRSSRTSLYGLLRYFAASNDFARARLRSSYASDGDLDRLGEFSLREVIAFIVACVSRWLLSATICSICRLCR